LDVSDAEHAPVEGQDGDLSKEECEGVKMFYDEQVPFGSVAGIFSADTVDIVRV
jgi:hypothetical protein